MEGSIFEVGGRALDPTLIASMHGPGECKAYKIEVNRPQMPLRNQYSQSLRLGLLLICLFKKNIYSYIIKYTIIILKIFSINYAIL